MERTNERMTTMMHNGDDIHTDAKADRNATTLPLKTSFVVTGFGPFGGVEENPTTAIVSELDAYLRSSSSGSDLADAVKEWYVVETSAEAVSETMDRIQKEHIDPLVSSSATSTPSATPTSSATSSATSSISNPPQDRLVLLHLGVARSEGFRLEACAYNEATFRIPDQSGYQPFGAPIVSDPNQPVGACFNTLLDLNGLHERLASEFPEIRTVISTDPGRYVCNYVYCKSLEKTLPANNVSFACTTTANSNEGVVVCGSLFLHVPHFECVPKPQQLAYVAAVLRALTES